MRSIKRGELYYADLRNNIGSEQGGIRPVLIIQNDIGNRYSPSTIVIPLTSQLKNSIPTHVDIHKNETNGLKSDSTILCEQLKTIDKDRRLKDKIGEIDDETLNSVLNAVKIGLAML